MKKLRIYLCLLVVSMLWVSCYEIDNGSSVDPITIYEKVNGSWTITSLKQVDEYAKANSIKPFEQDLTTWFNFGTFGINLNVDTDNHPTSFEVSGDVPALFLKSGYWDLSSAFPNTTQEAITINLYRDAAKTQLADQLKLTSIPGTLDQMEFRLVRSDAGVAYVSYVFNLTRPN